MDLDAAWTAWSQRGAEPTFTYRRPRMSASEVHDRLDRIDVDEVDDPVLHDLLAGKARELRLQADLLAARGRPDFLECSTAVYGGCEDDLFALACDLLERLPPADPERALVGPEAFVERAREEIERYRSAAPGFTGVVTLRHDVPSLMVVQHELLVGDDAWLPPERIEPLVHHEVGTHLLTAVTGAAQPLRLLEQGTAGYEETQEALAVLAEHLVGGLDSDRLRTIAARAVAVRLLVDGAGFDEVVDALVVTGCTVAAAWTVAARVFRSGGFTKDVIYLRGLDALVAHLGEGHDLGPLLVGKLALDARPAVEALLAVGLLREAMVRPRWLEVAGAGDRLARLERGEAPLSEW